MYLTQKHCRTTDREIMCVYICEIRRERITVVIIAHTIQPTFSALFRLAYHTQTHCQSEKKTSDSATMAERTRFQCSFFSPFTIFFIVCILIYSIAIFKLSFYSILDLSRRFRCAIFYRVGAPVHFHILFCRFVFIFSTKNPFKCYNIANTIRCQRDFGLTRVLFFSCFINSKRKVPIFCTFIHD